MKEVVLRGILESFGVPLPEFEYRFHPVRKWRFDMAWPAWGVAVEIEGAVWSKGRHVRGAGFISDMEKYNQAALLGWKLLRFTPQQIATEEASTLIKQALNV